MTAKALDGTYDDQDELIRSVREHVAAGGSVERLVDPLTQTLGWKDVSSGRKWALRANFVRARRAWKFGVLLNDNHGRDRVTAAFNHGHDWFDTTGCGVPGCREYAVEDVMTS